MNIFYHKVITYFVRVYDTGIFSKKDANNIYDKELNGVNIPFVSVCMYMQLHRSL